MKWTLRGFLNSLLPSSERLWAQEKAWHRKAVTAIIERDVQRERYCLDRMNECKAELDRRGVTHI